MNPEEIEALSDRLEQHNEWRRGEREDPDWPHNGYVATQYGLDLDTAVQLLRDLAKERAE